MADQNITLGGVLRSDGLDEADFEELRANFRGELLRSRDDSYDAARAVFNGMIDRRPAVIARCAGVADVIAAVNFAREHDVQVAVRGGGHSVPGYAVVDGGVVVEKFRRLVALKAKYDPDNLFRLNQNIKPSSKGGAAS
jgi:FAD/FMN-containing dehydrogenase